MIRNKFGVIMLFMAVTALSAFTLWHHGWGNYDQTKVLNFTGKILEVTYENPHGMIKFESEDKVWTVVLAPPARMKNRGLSHDILKNATQATIVGYPHLKIKDEMRAERITIGGQTTELR